VLPLLEVCIGPGSPPGWPILAWGAVAGNASRPSVPYMHALTVLPKRTWLHLRHRPARDAECSLRVGSGH